MNCCVIVHCLEVSCKKDQITSVQREWFIFVQLTDSVLLLYSSRTRAIYFDSLTHNKWPKHFRHCTKEILLIVGLCCIHLHVRGMILKFWSWRDISVTSNAACLKIVPNNNILFFYTTALTSFMLLEVVTRNLPRNCHTPNALIYQADCAYKMPHSLDKSSLSNSC